MLHYCTVQLFKKSSLIGYVATVFSEPFFQSSHYHNVIKPALIAAGFESHRECNHTFVSGDYRLQCRTEAMEYLDMRNRWTPEARYESALGWSILHGSAKQVTGNVESLFEAITGD